MAFLPSLKVLISPYIIATIKANACLIGMQQRLLPYVDILRNDFRD